MKLYSALILLCIFQFIILDGARVTINEKFIDAILNHFKTEITLLAKGIRLPDQDQINNLEFIIPNFNLNKIKISFTNGGLINIQINNLQPRLDGTIHSKLLFIKVKHNFVITLRNFQFSANFNVTSKYDKGVLVPDIQFAGDPNIDFSFNLDMSGFLGGLLGKMLQLTANFGKTFIMPTIKSQMKDILEKIMLKLPREISIGKYNLDITLSRPIQLRNKFLEITSKARLYDPSIPLTKSQSFRQVYFPNITTLENQLQIYISEYSINAAIYTLLMSHNKELKSTVSPSSIESFLPGFKKKYINLSPQIFFTGYPKASIEITEQSLNVNLGGIFLIKVPGQSSPIFNSTLNLSLKVEAYIANGQRVSARIRDLNAKVSEVTINEVCQSNTTLIENGLSNIKMTLIDLLNGFIKNYMEIPFPTFLGIKFTELTLQHKNHYLQINFNLVRGINTNKRVFGRFSGMRSTGVITRKFGGRR